MRSPEAVREYRAYQEAPPQPFAAKAWIGLKATKEVIAAAMRTDRLKGTKFSFPVAISEMKFA
ncbi:hypothetical protein RvVAR031_06450 [Agrobacterium vitis]|nr:hypothetical protein RvVAR031_06450 [Agrobacterium vitis]